MGTKGVVGTKATIMKINSHDKTNRSDRLGDRDGDCRWYEHVTVKAISFMVIQQSRIKKPHEFLDSNMNKFSPAGRRNAFCTKVLNPLRRWRLHSPLFLSWNPSVDEGDSDV